MRVLMLGWEFPPYISGGLGTACHGLTRAMSRRGTEVLFVLPRPVDDDYAGHVRLLSPDPGRDDARPAPGRGALPDAALDHRARAYTPTDRPAMANVDFLEVPSGIVRPYQRPAAAPAEASAEARHHSAVGDPLDTMNPGRSIGGSGRPRQRARASTPDAGADGEAEAGADPEGAGGCDELFQSVERYAELAQRLTRRERFDVVHAHDWMTFPAGVAIAAASGRPLVVHVHSTEYDRAGESVHSVIYNIERRGMRVATRIVCVSHLTRKICEHRYAADPGKVRVIYNGVDTEEDRPFEPRTTIRRGDKIVLFLGRLTHQKGPEYFLAAARRVLEKVRGVKFIIAGSGDLGQRMVERAARMGIGHKVLFTGFLRGRDVDRVFDMADVYVMPSVSEPFGIAPLEAIRHDVPVIISRNSGVAEVLTHALKVDFWDVEEMADKVLAVLRHPPLARTLRRRAEFEVRKLTWADAADRCVKVYREAVAEMAEAYALRLGSAGGVRAPGTGTGA